MKGMTPTTDASKNSNDNVKKKNVARVLFQQHMEEPHAACEISTGHQQRSYVHQRKDFLLQ